MKVRALLPTVNDGRGTSHGLYDEFDVDDERGEFLLGLRAVERVVSVRADATVGGKVIAQDMDLGTVVVDPPKRKPRTRKPKPPLTDEA